MRQPVKTPKPNYRAGSFPKSGSRATLALLVELQQKVDIGDRIKWLRDNSAESSRTIARYCDVSDEAVRNWIAGKGISWENTECVAEMFDVDVGWLWRGKGEAPAGYPVEEQEDEQSQTPDPFVGPYTAQLDRIERKLDEVLKILRPAEGEGGDDRVEGPGPRLGPEPPTKPQGPTERATDEEVQRRSA